MELQHLQMDPLLSEQGSQSNFQGNISKKNLYLAQGLTKDTTNKPGAVQPSQVSRETENCKEQVGHGHVLINIFIGFLKVGVLYTVVFRQLL